MTALIPRAELVVDRLPLVLERPLVYYRFARLLVVNPQHTARGLAFVEVKGIALGVRLPGELVNLYTAAVTQIKERRARDLIARAARAVACDECGRWGYHLVSCSRGGPR